MAHRTLNPVTAFWGDGREGPQSLTAEGVEAYWRRKDAGMAKARGASKAWAIEFPGVPEPFYWGSYRFETLPKLQAAGWKYSSKYGWRKNGKTIEELTQEK